MAGRAGSDGSDSALSLVTRQKPAEIGRESDLRIILWVVADHAPRIGNAPERARVVRHPVEDLERHAPFVLDPLGLDRPHKQLLQVAGADVRSEVALVRSRAALEPCRLDLARCADSDLHDLQAAPERTAGIRKAQR